LTLTSSLDDQEQSKQNRTLTMFIFPFAELVLLGIFPLQKEKMWHK